MSLRELTDVLAALLFYNFLLSFMLTGCDGCIESDSKSLSRSVGKRSLQKDIRPSSKVRLGVIWPETLPPDENQWQSGELRHINCSCGTVFVCPQFPYRGNDTIFGIFPTVPCHAFCMWHWPIGKDLDLSFIWGHHLLHIVDLWISVDQLNTSQLATPCWRDPTRSKQLSTVAVNYVVVVAR